MVGYIGVKGVNGYEPHCIKYFTCEEYFNENVSLKILRILTNGCRLDLRYSQNHLIHSRFQYTIISVNKKKCDIFTQTISIYFVLPLEDFFNSWSNGEFPLNAEG